MQKYLQALPYFEGIELKILEDLISNRQIIKKIYHKGLTVHEQHSKCWGMDIVCSGKLVAYALGANGSETIVFDFQKGDVVGANLLFGKENKYPMNIYCLEDCTTIHIAKEAVLEFLKEYTFVLPFVKLLSLNSQGMNQKIAMYTQKNLRENIMDYLGALSLEQGTKIITIPISKKQLADHFGVQRPSLFRELKKMKDQGLIEIDNRQIKILF